MWNCEQSKNYLSIQLKIKIMNTKNMYFVIAFNIITLGSVMAQTNNDSCAILGGAHSPFLNKYRMVTDSTYYDLTNHERDDIANYPKLLRKAGGDNRLLYFTHGYGGDDISWMPGGDGLSSIYEYIPMRPVYTTEQSSFWQASFKVWQQLGSLENEFTNSYKYKHTALPYYIGASLGGLVGRDIYKKFKSSDGIDILDPDPLIPQLSKGSKDLRIFNINPLKFHFGGIVTFGTPHAGAVAAGNQQMVLNLSDDVCEAMNNVITSGFALDVTLKRPILSFIIGGQLDKLSQVGDRLCDVLSQNLLPIFTEKSNAKIGLQFLPTSPYLTQLNNFPTPDLPKVAFYAVEKEPVFWRIAKYYIKPPTDSDYGYYGANDDQDIVDNVNQIMNDYLAQENELNKAIEINKSSVKNRKNVLAVNYLICWPCALTSLIKIKEIEQVIKRQEAASQALSNAGKILSNVNKQYQTIIGANDPSNPAMSVEVTKYRCLAKYTKKKIAVFYDINNPNECYCNNPAFDYDLRGKCVSTEVQTYKTIELRTIPNDGAVLVPSAMAFPGCPDKYKHLMKDSNHLQLRNDENTRKMLIMLFEADQFAIKRGIPNFFFVPKR